MTDDAVAPALLSCPTCRRPVATRGPARPASFPFCSERCRWRDLGGWFAERYGVPVAEQAAPGPGEPAQ
ncbi:MAG: DNA gyrase inhibitor YacG [Planctomycetota bacterium]|nr:DNA gyrase inhibitor YacG [Planctomycetota bacterium]MCX8039653.1 DNA gyrase inhibitor YacG [Planctomycetota bacterium]MDW8373512.1 DNA gyrase inhibitor YacG [Planctomycetota bacterium]